MAKSLLRRLVVLALAFGLSAGIARPLSGQTQPHDPERFRARTTAILVDVVVRDRQGRPVTDLTAADFHLHEDDVRQTIQDVTMVAPAERSRPLAAPEAGDSIRAGGNGDAVPQALETPTFVALVFDRLSPEARALAYNGAQAYLENARSDDFAGVFLSDLHLETIQTYTNDREKLRAAIQTAASRPTGSFAGEANRIGGGGMGDADPAVPATVGAESQGPRWAMGSGASDPASGLLRQMADRTERAYETLIRDQQGLATTNALLALIEGLSVLPGRKTVVFFAEALALPPRVMSRFEAVVANANRSNVSIYAIDAAGLRVHSGTSEMARRLLQPDSGSSAAARLERLEGNEGDLRRDPDVSLRMLAERTGGFLINNTNDLQRGFREIDADRRFHYLLAYTPSNTDFRGEWRRIAVKVKRPDLTVRSRAGSVAVHARGVLPLLAYEGPSMAVLERSPLPTDLPVRAGAFAFPQATGPARVVVLVATSAPALTFQHDADTLRAEFTVLARLRNAQGEIVRKGSQPYRLSGPASEMDAARQGQVLFFRQPELDAGVYTLEFVVHDALAERAGAGTAKVVVPSFDPATLRVSNLVIVERAEPVPPDERDPANPLHYGDLLLYPSLGEPVSKSANGALSFYLDIIASPHTAPVSAAIEVRSAGTPLAQAPLELSAPGPDGRIQHVARLSLESFAPGDYELLLTISQGVERQRRMASFRIVQ